MNNFFLVISLMVAVLLGSPAAYAQQPVEATPSTTFSVQLGVFKRPDTTRFSTLSGLDRIYTEIADSTLMLTRIYIGRFPTRSEADSLLQQIRARGFRDAFVIQKRDERSPYMAAASRGTKTLYSIQIGAYQDRGLIPDLKPLENLGKIYQFEQNNYIKVRLGIFSVRDSAMAKLVTVRALGYTQAFVCEADLPMQSRGTAIGESIFQIASSYKRMQGKLNGLPVLVHMYFSSDASVMGFYNDPATGVHKRFSYYGAVNSGLPDDKAQASVSPTVFPAGISNGQPFKMDFTVKEKDKQLKFLLVEQYSPGTAQFRIESIRREKTRKLSKGQVGVDLLLEYPVMKYSNTTVEQKFNNLAIPLPNAAAEKTLTAKVETQLNADVDKVSKYFPQYTWLSSTYETKIMENTQYLLSVRYTNENIIIEPETSIVYKSFNLRTGTQLLLSDVMTNGYQSELRRALEKRVREQSKGRGSAADVTQAVEDLLQNYYFSLSGIVFVTDAQREGLLPTSLEITVPYKEIRAWVKKEGFLKDFVK